MLQEFKNEHDIIAEYFNSVPENDNRCADEQVTHLLSLYIKKIRHLSLENDAVKHIIGNWYFQPIAAYFYDRYPNRGDFKWYVSCSDLPLGTDYFQ